MTGLVASTTDLHRELSASLQGRVLQSEPMAGHTTFGLGGPADLFVLAESISDLQTTLLFADQNRLTVVALGDGSNVLVSDRGVRGIVVKLVGSFDEMQIVGDVLIAGAGAGFSRAIAHLSSAGFAGLEILYGVPGSIGGGICMNAGTRYGWLSDLLIDAELINRNGIAATATAKDLGMSYRHSILQDTETPPFVTSARFQLKQEAVESVKLRIAAIAKARQDSQPLNWRSCGCMFKNPEGDSAGRLIDSCGLRGLSIGNVAVSDKHANFFVTRESCKAADVKALALKVQESVRQQAGVELELEVKLLGEWADD
ncbi:MAG: UDP-N-acetylmuramate dehydrogenase [Armatimonadota bacterium]